MIGYTPGPLRRRASGTTASLVVGIVTRNEACWPSPTSDTGTIRLDTIGVASPSRTADSAARLVTGRRACTRTSTIGRGTVLDGTVVGGVVVAVGAAPRSPATLNVAVHGASVAIA